MSDVDDVVRDALSWLAFLGVVLAVLLTLTVLVGILRSLWRVTFGTATLILPFGGSDHGALNEVLAQQLDQIERQWQKLSAQIREEEGTVEEQPTLVDLGPLSRALADKTLDEGDQRFISDQPIDGQTIGPISFAGVTLAPETLFNIFYRIRSAVARRIVRASLVEFGPTARLSAVFVFGKRADDHRRRSSHSEVIVLVRELGAPGQLLDVIDDLAFRIAKLRLGFTSEGERWSAYHAFLEGYAQHIRFLRTGEVADRERAIALYDSAVSLEPDYRLARYNLGVLLYNRYVEDANALAIGHFTAAAEAPDPLLRALALAALTLAYAQNVHRFGLGPDPWSALADEASSAAVKINGELEETNFARGWAHQVNGRTDEALEWYERTIHLEGEKPSELQIKSFAQNNQAFLYMTVVKDLDRAETLFRDALGNFPNKMAHANLGEIYKRRKQFDRALREYDDALRLDPRYAAAMNEKGMVYLAQASEEADHDGAEARSLLGEAERCHRKALDLVPATAPHQLEDMRAKYEAARRQYGFELTTS